MCLINILKNREFFRKSSEKEFKLKRMTEIPFEPQLCEDSLFNSIYRPKAKYSIIKRFDLF